MSNVKWEWTPKLIVRCASTVKRTGKTHSTTPSINYNVISFLNHVNVYIACDCFEDQASFSIKWRTIVGWEVEGGLPWCRPPRRADALPGDRPPHEQNDIRLWNHYLPETSFSDGKNDTEFILYQVAVYATENNDGVCFFILKHHVGKGVTFDRFSIPENSGCSDRNVRTCVRELLRSFCHFMKTPFTLSYVLTHSKGVAT